MIKIILTKIVSTHKNLRTNEIEGQCETLPVIGEDFVMVGEGLEFGTRFVRTTNVVSVEQIDKEIQFKTANSTYKIKVLDAQE